MKTDPQLDEKKEPEFIFMTMWMFDDVPEPFHLLITELFKQGKVKILLDCPPRVY